MNKNIPLYIDLIFCIVLLPVMIMLFPVEHWLTIHPIFVVLLVLWLYAVYFINRKIVIPFIFTKGKYWVGIIITLVMVAVTYILSSYDFGPRPHDLPPFFAKPPEDGKAVFGRTVFRMKMHEQSAWFLFFVVYSFSVAVALLTQLFRKSMEKQEAEMARDKAELALYKAQINPHFMFNTLNALYGLIVTKSDKAETAFDQFIAMVRYMYSNSDRDFIPLCEEADYIRQFIELQKLRLNGHTKVNFEYNSDRDGYQIAPMLLITFVENAFKYGVSSHKKAEIMIELVAEGGKIRFRVSNDIMKQGSGKGIGIQNCRRRLELLYPGSNELEIKQLDGKFIVELELNEKL